jgi:hypothetical protein
MALKKQPSYKAPKSVLYVFTGHTHLINVYLDVSKKIKKGLKKIMGAFNL